MVRQDLKNNQLIGMSAGAEISAKLVRRGKKQRRERPGCVGVQRHLASDVKTFARLQWVMMHTTEAQSQR